MVALENQYTPQKENYAVQNVSSAPAEKPGLQRTPCFPTLGHPAPFLLFLGSAEDSRKGWEHFRLYPEQGESRLFQRVKTTLLQC